MLSLETLSLGQGLPHGQGRMVPTQCHKITFSELTFRFQVHIWDRKSCETSPAPLSTGQVPDLCLN